MDLLLVEQLEAVLDGAQEAVGLVESIRVCGIDVAGGAELGECPERGGHPDAGVRAAVDELQQLHGELDVADPAPAELDLPFGHTAA